MKYSNYCGPAAVANLLGISKENAANALRLHKAKHQKRVRATTTLTQISRLLTTVKFKHELIDLKYARISTNIPLKLWLSSMLMNKLALVRVKTKGGGHLITICDGKVMEDNGVDSLNFKVTHWIEIKRG